MFWILYRNKMYQYLMDRNNVSILKYDYMKNALAYYFSSVTLESYPNHFITRFSSKRKRTEQNRTEQNTIKYKGVTRALKPRLDLRGTNAPILEPTSFFLLQIKLLVYL